MKVKAIFEEEFQQGDVITFDLKSEEYLLGECGNLIPVSGIVNIEDFKEGNQFNLTGRVLSNNPSAIDKGVYSSKLISFTVIE